MRKYIKKLIGLVLALSLCLGAAGISTPASAEQISEETDRAMQVLRMFSFIPDYYDYNTDLSAKVTRADFVSAIAKIVNMTEYSGDPYYYDVPQTHWAYKEINALTRGGILNGESDRMFEPDNAITTSEAIKPLVVALGYGDWAEYNGGYPTGYIRAAGRLGIVSGASDAAELTVGDMLVYLYRAVTASVSEPVYFSSDGNQYRTDQGNTLLSIYHNVYCARGTLRGVNGITLSGGSLKQGQAMIDDTVYETKIPLDEYIGQKIDVLYESDKYGNAKTIVWGAATLGAGDNMLVIDADHNTRFDADSFELTYTLENGRQRSVKLPRDIAVIYNGRIATGNLAEIFNAHKYTLKLVTNGSGSYSTAVVRRYENYYVSNIDASSRTIYDTVGKTRRELKLDESLYDYLSITMNGTAKAFSDIQRNTILSVYISQDKRAAEVHIVNDTVSGAITSVTRDDIGKTLLIDGVEYYMPEESPDADVEAGRDVVLYLDDGGQVAYVKLAAGSYTPAYLYMGQIENYNFSYTIRFKLLNSDGEVLETICASKVTIDGIMYAKNMDEAFERLCSGGSFKPQFVMLRTNSRGEITVIDTVNTGAGGEDDVLKVSAPYVTNAAYVSGSLENYAVLDNNSKIFFVPNDARLSEAEDREFHVGNKSGLTNWIYYNFESYKVAERIGYEQFVLIKGADEASSRNLGETLPVLVEYFADSVNEDGAFVKTLVGYRGADEINLPLGDGIYESQGFDKVQKGDVIRLGTASDGTIQFYDMLFDCDDPPSPSISAYNTVFGQSKGYAYDYTDGVLRISLTNDGFGTGGRTIETNGVPCLIYDKNAPSGKEIYKGTVDQANTYMDVGTGCSMVYEMQARGKPKMLVIYL